MSEFSFDTDFIVKMQYYAVSQLRVNEDYKNLCEVIGKDLNDLKTISEYLLKSIDIETASGVWLDYLGWLVGTSRGIFDTSKFFSANAEDVNKELYIWFPNSTNQSASNLSDDLFRKKIYAKIGYNISKGTRAENNYIIKNMTFADSIKINRIKIFDKSNFTVIGTPTITDDGIATAFTTDDRITAIPSALTNITSSSVIEFELELTTGSEVVNTEEVAFTIGASSRQGLGVCIRDNNQVWVSGNLADNASSCAALYNFEYNTAYKIYGKTDFTGSTYGNLYAEIRDEKGKLLASGTGHGRSGLPISYDRCNGFISVGSSNVAGQYVRPMEKTSVDLKTVSVKIDGEEVFNGWKWKFAPMQLDITLTGSNIIQTSTFKDDIENVLGQGVAIRNLIVN